jgi:anti-sigma-K factor RskA
MSSHVAFVLVLALMNGALAAVMAAMSAAFFAWKRQAAPAVACVFLVLSYVVVAAVVFALDLHPFRLKL